RPNLLSFPTRRSSDLIRLSDGLAEGREIFGVVRKIRVHFEHVLVAALQRPFEPGNVSAAQTLFARALQHEDGFLVLGPSPRHVRSEEHTSAPVTDQSR